MKDYAEMGLLSDKSLPAHDQDSDRFASSKNSRILKKAAFLSFIMVMLYCSYSMLFRSMLVVAGTGPGQAVGSSGVSKGFSKFSQYFDPNPEIYPGPTATGRAPFTAQETMAPMGEKNNKTIQQMFGHLSPYSPNIIGFGVEEQPLPPGANIIQVHTLHRHGSRYPTVNTNVQGFGGKMAKISGKYNATGSLSFLNTWSYGLGEEIMVPQGRLQLFESGVNHYYNYGHLYNPNSKILVRTTTQMRMRESAWNFLTGFFGFDWASKVDVGYGIEGDGQHWNNSLAGYDNCDNGNSFRNQGGFNASEEWQGISLQNATERINSMIEGVDFTLKDVYAMQTMCPYEIAAYAYSPFCDLFTTAEWEAFEYGIDIMFAGYVGYQSPTGRAVGLGWVQELASRLKRQTLGYSGSQINTTLDSNEKTFPVNQSLYFDFSHDTNIMSIITALGFTQFSQFLPADHQPGLHNLTVSQVTPFAARLDIEVIRTPQPLLPDQQYNTNGEETQYLRFKLNERTLPHPECGMDRMDGLCELDVFLGLVEGLERKADYEYACTADYEAVPYGEITDGRPNT
ncbi:3-phytase A [Lachnellula hyalina]|uniref:3-phytase n=1 Tax=Lachnellula hyalina TaxID=1316788 RepID=A0A8H8R8G0_9HELO|nr:3-phytase A [Lachnellula hyalina]TVY30406.1 3-phytase A [Lachnellula hyalina]